MLNGEEQFTLILDDALANSFIAPATDDFENDTQLSCLCLPCCFQLSDGSVLRPSLTGCLNFPHYHDVSKPLSTSSETLYELIPSESESDYVKRVMLQRKSMSEHLSRTRSWGSTTWTLLLQMEPIMILRNFMFHKLTD